MEFTSCNSTPSADVGQLSHLQKAFLVLTQNIEDVLEHYCGALSDVPLGQMLNVWHCKRKQNNITR